MTIEIGLTVFLIMIIVGIVLNGVIYSQDDD